VLVTVPPSGSPRGLLWERFCEAADLDPLRFDASRTVNESLGAASAEVIRFVSAALNGRDSHKQTSRVLKKTLAKAVLNARKSEEPTLILPHSLEEWAQRRTDELVADVKSVPSSLVGDLDDLRPRFAGARSGETEDPSALPVDELMAAAGYGLAAFCELFAENGLAPRGYGPDDGAPRRASRRKNRP
jgi:hypothetical protein